MRVSLRRWLEEQGTSEAFQLIADSSVSSSYVQRQRGTVLRLMNISLLPYRNMLDIVGCWAIHSPTVENFMIIGRKIKNTFH